MISVHFQSKPFNITVIQVYALTINAEKVEWFYEDLQDLLELTPKKDVLFVIGGWNVKVGSQETPGVIGKFGLEYRMKKDRIHRVLPRECTGHSKHFQLHKRRLYTWTSPDGEYQNQTDYIPCSQRWRSSIQSAKIRSGPDCGSVMNSLLQNSGISWRKYGNPLDHSGIT